MLHTSAKNNFYSSALYFVYGHAGSYDKILVKGQKQ